MNNKGKFYAAEATGVTPEQSAREVELTRRTAEADKDNSKRSGKGTRVRVGQTRGKNPKVIDWEAFDTDKPETCPETQAEFMDLTKTQDEKMIVKYLIDGFNDSQYSQASDVLGEFVEPNWPPELAKQFKLTISNYVAAMAGAMTVEDAVELLKPNIVKAFNARLAAAQG